MTDVIGLLRGTTLPTLVNGGIYRSGTRPRDSRAEDIVVIFTAADAEQFQSGVVTINIYVPDIGSSENGVSLVDSGRCEEIEEAAQSAVKGLTADKSNYIFKLQNAIHTQRDEEINQSFVVIRLGFKYIN